MPTSISGVNIPDSKMARAATELVRDTEGEMLFTHSMRVYLWAALAGERDRLTFDPELLYVASLFHDLGLVERYHQSRHRFEVDGANAAREFLRAHLIPEEDVRNVWLSIALHTAPGIADQLEPEISLLHTGAVMDVVGRGYDQFTDEQRKAVLEAYPRDGHFNQALIDAFYEALKKRPHTTYGSLNADYLAFKDPKFQRGNVCSLILNSPWAV
jgi:hypothetical protein